MFIKKLASFTALSASAIASFVYAGSVHAVAAPAASNNLLVNGSFENTTLVGTNKTWATYSSINGWSATGNGKIEVQRNGVAGSAYDGSNLVELDSDHYNKNQISAQNPLGLFQDVATTVGKTYSLSFAYSARPNTAAVDNIFDILVGDVTNKNNIFQQSISAGAGASNTAWSIFTTTFKATSQLSRVQFNYTGPLNTLGAYIDDVKLVAVTPAKSASTPEPSAMAGMVIIGLGLVTLKKRNASLKLRNN